MIWSYTRFEWKEIPQPFSYRKLVLLKVRTRFLFHCFEHRAGSHFVQISRKTRISHDTKCSSKLLNSYLNPWVFFSYVAAFPHCCVVSLLAFHPLLMQIARSYEKSRQSAKGHHTTIRKLRKLINHVASPIGVSSPARLLLNMRNCWETYTNCSHALFGRSSMKNAATGLSGGSLKSRCVQRSFEREPLARWLSVAAYRMSRRCFFKLVARTHFVIGGHSKTGLYVHGHGGWRLTPDRYYLVRNRLWEPLDRALWALMVKVKRVGGELARDERKLSWSTGHNQATKSAFPQLREEAADLHPAKWPWPSVSEMSEFWGISTRYSKVRCLI